MTGLIGILLLTGCGGNTIKDTLIADNGKWILNYNSFESDHMKFYEDGNVEFYSGSKVAVTGTYEVKEKEKRIIISLPHKKKLFNDIEIKNGDISFKYGEKNLTMKKEE